MLKSPIDMALYLLALQELKPKVIFEIGSRYGGSALWLSDMAKVFGLDVKVFSIDIDVPKMDEKHQSSVTFLEGDCRELGLILGKSFLDSLPRPFLVIEDSSHQYEDVLKVMDFWKSHLKQGELLVIEDGVLNCLGLSDEFKGGPNRAVKEFFQSNPDTFEINRRYCDFYGKNATYSPNGWLIKT